jgi:hypothetical protein
MFNDPVDCKHAREFKTLRPFQKKCFFRFVLLPFPSLYTVLSFLLSLYISLCLSSILSESLPFFLDFSFFTFLSVQVKLNPELPWKKQHSASRGLFSPANWT